MIKAAQIFLDSIKPFKENTKEHDIRNVDGDEPIFAEKFKSTLEKIKDSKISKSTDQNAKQPIKENSSKDEDEKTYKRSKNEGNLDNLQVSIHFPVGMELSNIDISNIDIMEGSALINNLHIQAADIGANDALNSIKIDEKNPLLLDSTQNNIISDTSQEFSIDTPIIDHVENQTDSQYIENYNEQISIEKTMDQKTHLELIEKSNTGQLIINESKIELENLAKAEEQLNLQSKQWDKDDISINLHTTQELNMKYVSSNENQKHIDHLMDNEAKIYTQKLKTEQEEINQKDSDDIQKGNMQLRLDNLNVIESTTRQDSPLDFTEVLFSHELTEKIKFIDQLADKAVMTINKGSTEIEIQVKPEHLGKLILKVGLDDGILTGKIYTFSQEIKEFLQENLDILRNSLRDQGLVFASLDVDVGSQSNPNNFNYLPAAQPSSRKPSKFTAFFTMETDEGKSTLLGSLNQIDYLA